MGNRQKYSGYKILLTQPVQQINRSLVSFSLLLFLSKWTRSRPSPVPRRPRKVGVGKKTSCVHFSVVPLVGILVLSNDIWTPAFMVEWENFQEFSYPQLFKISVYNLELYPLILFITVLLVKNNTY